MKKLLRFLVVFVFFFSALHIEVYAQKKSRAMKKADYAYNLEEYSKAADLYKKAYKILDWHLHYEPTICTIRKLFGTFYDLSVLSK